MRSLFRTPWWLAFILLVSPVLGQADLYTIDPNGDDAPEAVKNLELTFQFNAIDLIAPQILFEPNGLRAFINYQKAKQDSEHGYVLVTRPLESDPAARIETTLVTERTPAFMTFNPAGTELWVVCLGEFGNNLNESCKIYVFSLETLEEVAIIDASEYRFGYGSNLIFTPGGGKAFVSSAYTDQILRIDAGSHLIDGVLTLHAAEPYYYMEVGPSLITLSNNGSFLCSTNTANNTVSIIDVDTFSEIHQVVFQTEENDPGDGHTDNFTFRNNVLLSSDDTIGLIASVGSRLSVLITDRVYKFDVASGQPIVNEEGFLEYLSVNNSPAILTFDPSGDYLVVQGTSQDVLDTSGTSAYGFPEISMFNWPELTPYKFLQYRSPPYNMARTSIFSFWDNGDGTHDLLFPSFSTYDEFYSNFVYETIVRIPLKPLEHTNSVRIINETEDRDIPLTLVNIPGQDLVMVANLISGTLDILPPKPNEVFSAAFSVFIEEGQFSSVALMNLHDEPVTYSMQSIQTDRTDDGEDNTNAGIPFYWIDYDEDEAGVVKIIPPYELTLQPGEQHVRMLDELIPDYDKVEEKHGFLKAVNEKYPLQGLVFNGENDENGKMIRGDYLRFDRTYRQDMVFPFLRNGGFLQNTIHVMNPYFNQYLFGMIFYDATGLIQTTDTVIISNTTGSELRYDLPMEGYILTLNESVLKSLTFMVYDNQFENSPYLFTCPPLNPNIESRTQAYHLPYFAVGGDYDTSIILISFNEPHETDEEGNPVLDDEDNPIPLYTHARVEIYDNDGDLFATREIDFANTTRFEIYFSDEELLDSSRYLPDIFSGSAVIYVDRDYVVGACTYTEWDIVPDVSNPELLVERIQNMTVDALPQTQDVSTEIVFPYTINIAPFQTSYVINNPGELPAMIHVEAYNSAGEKIAESQQDHSVAGRSNFIFFLGQADVFGEGAIPENFVGYMKVRSTNGRPFLAKSIQFSPDMLALIPTM